MCCYFNLIGVDFNPDDFVLKSKLTFDTKKYKGEYANSLKKRKNKWSLLSVRVTKSSFDDFEGQVKEVMTYLTENKEKLKHIRLDPTIEYATFDFGVDYYPEKFVQSFYFPPELISLARDLAIGFEISAYNQDMISDE